MKNSIFTLLATMIFVVACGPQDKRAELESLKKQQNELAARIKTLEAELVDTNPEANNQRITTVQVATVNSTPFVHLLKVQGRIDSDKNVMLSAKASGTVTNLYAREGQQVRKGQVLAQIDATMLESSMAELQTSLDLANNLYERQQKLWEQKIGTEIQYLQAKNNKEALENRIASLNEQIEQTKIIAPFAGTVDEVNIKAGEVVAPGVPAIRLVNPSDFKVVAEIAENYISRVQQGNNAIIQIPDLNISVDSKVSTVSRVINPVNRTFMVELKLPAKLYKEVKANMIAYVNIEDYRNENAVVVPINAIQHSETEGDYVFVAENNKAVLTPVEIGKTFENQAEVLSGIKAGDKIIVTGQQDLVNEQLIAYNQQN